MLRRPRHEVGAGGAGGVTSRIFAPDASDVIRYTLDETAAPWANSGSGGAATSRDRRRRNVEARYLSGASTPVGRGLAFRGLSQDRVQGGASIEPRSRSPSPFGGSTYPCQPGAAFSRSCTAGRHVR